MTKRKDNAPAKPKGRPSGYTQTIADAICERLANGESLRTICKEEGMPSQSMVYRWLETNEEFREQYTRGRAWQSDYYAESIVDIADEEVTMIKKSKHSGGDDSEGEGEVEVVFDPTAVARNRLRVDARKWYASKLAPKKYGDRQHIDMEVKDVTPLAERLKQARERVKIAAASE